MRAKNFKRFLQIFPDYISVDPQQLYPLFYCCTVHSSLTTLTISYYLAINIALCLQIKHGLLTFFRLRNIHSTGI